MSGQDPAIPVRTLLHHGGVSFALRGFASLRSALGGALPPLVVHDDGSLTDADAEQLQEAFPGTRIVRKAEADDRLAPLLAQRPACASYRAYHAFGIKLFDVMMLSEGPLRYLDGDILFLKRMQALFPADTSRACTLFEPTQNCQSASLRALIWKRGLTQVQQTNAGAYQLPAGCIDPDFLEWYLSKEDLNGIRVFAEQTLVSVIASRHRPLRWDPSQFICRMGPLADGPRIGAIHFIGTQKDHFHDFPLPAQPQSVEMGFEPAPVLSRFSLATNRLRDLFK